MADFFLQFLKVNLLAAGAVGLVLAAEKLWGKRWTAAWKYVIWLAVSLLVLLPVRLPPRQGPWNGSCRSRWFSGIRSSPGRRRFRRRNRNPQTKAAPPFRKAGKRGQRTRKLPGQGQNIKGFPRKKFWKTPASAVPWPVSSLEGTREKGSPEASA